MAAFAARIAGVPAVTITSTFNAHQLGGHRRHALEASLAGAEFDPQIPAFDIAELAQAGAQCVGAPGNAAAEGTANTPTRMHFRRLCEGRARGGEESAGADQKTSAATQL